MGMLAQGRVFCGVGEEQHGGRLGAEPRRHVVDGITDLKFFEVSGEGNEFMRLLARPPALPPLGR